MVSDSFGLDAVPASNPKLLTIGWTGNITEGDKNRIATNEGKRNIPYQLEYTQDDGTKVKENFWTVGRGHRLDKKTKKWYRQ